ncbi:SDR family NAD(P)-dependent oxidoreductase [Ulvibacterium marinum]|uniref:SDR family NAD(P)-dependent oxidoreductase n=1 Tax=Ulvibacterium marinum TaxID=2419782 RepID=UPI002494C374|nr:SDR family NAD(P)-dependent oxidoreductase [Ulvibacterium marinum]
MKINDFFQSVFITGANRGMGLGYVVHYLKKNFSVIATAKNPDSAGELLRLKKEYPDQLSVLELDVSCEASILSLVDQLQSMGVTFLLAINNAGISLEEEFGKWTKATFEAHFRVNTIGPALISQALLPFLEKGAKLIQISSGLGSLGQGSNLNNNLSAYAASKCALHSITVHLAEKLRTKNIMVFVINPGWVKTKMGGDEAPTTIDEAIGNITGTIERLTFEQTGSFLSEKGEPILW